VLPRASNLILVPLLMIVFLAIARPAGAACTPPPSFASELNGHPDAAVYASLGKWYASHNQPACAAEAFAKAVAMQPNSADDAYLLGLSLYSTGQATQAIAPLLQSIRLNPQSAEGHLVLASALEQASRRQDAEVQWRIALALDPGSEIALSHLSHDLLADRNYPAVIELLGPMAAAGHLNTASAIDLSVAYTRSGLPDDASALLHATLRADPTSVPAIEALAAVLVMQGEFQEAVDLLSAAARQHPSDLHLQVLDLRVLVMARNPNAEPLAARLLAAHPHQGELLYLAGLLRQQSGDLPGALRFFEQSVAQNPDYADARFQLGVVLESQNDNTAARAQLEKAVALGFDSPQIYFVLGRALHALGNEAAARQEFERYQQAQRAESNQTQAAMKSWQGNQAQAAGDLEQAAADYRAAVALDPAEPLLAYKLAMVLDKAGNHIEERAALEQALQDDPHMAVAQNQLGYLDSVEGNTNSAVRHFQLAVQADPGYAKAWMNLAAALCLQSDWQDARTALARVLELDPKNAAAQELLQRLNSMPVQP
jgi:tetratricopeptide (TPR) repeat protein